MGGGLLKVCLLTGRGRKFWKCFSLSSDHMCGCRLRKGLTTFGTLGQWAGQGRLILLFCFAQRDFCLHFTSVDVQLGPSEGPRYPSAEEIKLFPPQMTTRVRCWMRKGQLSLNSQRATSLSLLSAEMQVYTCPSPFVYFEDGNSSLVSSSLAPSIICKVF